MSETEAPARLGLRQSLVLLVLCGQLFLDSMDVSLMSIALPDIQRDLGAPESTVQWVISGYAIAYGGFLLFGGRVSDYFGRRKVFIAATGVFVVANVLGGLSPWLPMLIGARVLTGIAAGFIAPAALSVITTTFTEGSMRNKALGLYGVTGASGYSAGLILSGVLTSADWRLTFLLPAVLSALVLVLALRVISPDSGLRTKGRSFDLAGAVSVTAGVLLLVFGLTEAAEAGWDAPLVYGSLVVAVALLVLFVVIERRKADPLLPLGIFRLGTVAGGNLMGVFWAAASIGWQFVATLYLQDALGYSPLIAGLSIVPLGVTIVVVVNVTPKLIGRFGLRAVATTGMLVQAVGVLTFVAVSGSNQYFSLLFWALILHGAGNGLSFPCFNIGGTNGVPDRQQGMATALVTAAVQIGTGVGVAILALVLKAASPASAVADLSAYRWAFLVAGVFSLLGATSAFVGLRTRTAVADAEQPSSPVDAGRVA